MTWFKSAEQSKKSGATAQSEPDRTKVQNDRAEPNKKVGEKPVFLDCWRLLEPSFLGAREDSSKRIHKNPYDSENQGCESRAIPKNPYDSGNEEPPRGSASISQRLLKLSSHEPRRSREPSHPRDTKGSDRRKDSDRDHNRYGH